MKDKVYIGTAEFYDESIFVNTGTGEGLDRALKKIEPLLCKMAASTFISGYSFYDIKQELAAIAIDGIRSYNPDKNVKMSTFLHIHLRNKLISKLRSENKMSNDAFLLNDGQPVPKKVRGEINFSQVSDRMSSGGDDYKDVDFESNISSELNMFGSHENSHEKTEFASSLARLVSTMDRKTSKIIELIYLRDYSIKDAAAEVGLSGWAASMRLKKLSKNRLVKDLFDKKMYQ